MPDLTDCVDSIWTRDRIRKMLKRLKAGQLEIAYEESDYDQEKLQERLAKLAGGITVIGVGVATETEMKE